MFKRKDLAKRCFLLLLSIIMIMTSTDMTAFAIEPIEGMSEKTVSAQEMDLSLEGVTRITGEERYATSLLVADTYKEILGIDKFQAVIIASGKNFADALSVPYLASVKKAPILFTDNTDNNVDILYDYIKTNVKEDGRVYIIGGTGAISLNVENKFSEYTIKRISGADRYETNLAILEEAGLNSKTLFVASGREYASVLSTLALEQPVLLVNKSLSENQKTIIENSVVKEIYIVGDTSSVSEEVEKSLRESELSVYRIAGEDDVATSVTVAQTMFASPKAAVITHADIFTYGLCSAPLAAELKVPLLIADESNNEAVVDYAKSYGISAGYVIGAEYKISDDTILNIFSLNNNDEILLKGTRLEDDITPPEAPSMYEYETTSSSVNLWWNGSSSEDFVKYEVFNLETDEVLLETTDRKVTISELKPNTTYSIGVRAVDAAGNKSSALIYTFTTDKGTLYKISWDTNGDGDIDDTTEYVYGEIPSHAEGYKPADAKYTYTFTGWSPDITPVTGNITYTAQFKQNDINSGQESSKSEKVIRIADEDQYATSLLIADTYKELFSIDKFDTVIVASGSNFADAISGSYLAYVKKAPILLTDNLVDTSSVVDYIKSNVKESGTIYLLGGEGIISFSFEENFSEYTVKRISGYTRYETNLGILQEAGMNGKDIFVTTGRGYSEYLSALALKRPVLLINRELDDAQIEFLENAEIENIYIAGDTSSVPEKVEEILRNYGTVTRFSGENSSLVSAQINRNFFTSTAAAVITHANAFTYGLCGAPLAAELNIPLVITNESDTAAAVEYAKNTGICTGYVIGAENEISNEMVVDIYALNNADEIISAGDKTEAREFYTIGWDTNGDGKVDETIEYQYGITPVYAAGYKMGDEQYSYIFTGWSPTVTSVMSDRIHTAQFEKIVNKYNISWDIDGDGVIDETTEYEYGASIVHDDVYKEPDAQYTYTFTGWSPSITSVTGNQNYTAQFEKTVNKYNISWDIDGDGVIDDVTEVAYGSMPAHAAGHKESDAQYTYTFTGWNPSITSVTGDKTYTAQFTKTVNKYNISWDIDGDGVIDDVTEVAYGSMPTHSIGFKEADEQYTYIFTGWSPSITSVTGDKTYTARFAKTVNKYNISWDTNGDGIIDDVTEAAYGSTPAHAAGHKESDAQYTYTFTGWNPSLTSVTGDKTYTAQFTKTVNKYKISWDVDGDGVIDETTEYEYGETPVQDDAYKEADEQYTYTFTGWSPSITSVTDDKTYTAQFSKTVNKYKISWDIDGDGVVDETTEYEYGATPVHNDGHKEADEQYTYTFTGWSPGIISVTGDKTYTAQFAKTVNKYKISWDIDGDGVIDETTEYEYGATPAHDDAYKEADEQYSYIFIGWSPSITSVTGDKTYTAQFEQKEITIKDKVVRLYGSGRYETGYAVADALKEALDVEQFEAVVVATGTNFADALAGSYLAVGKNAPILLTNGKEKNIAELHAYIKENVVSGGKVYILGGTGAVPESVENIDGYDVVRLFGTSRYDTNLEILAAAGITGDAIIVATGKTFADSLSASAAKLPILLVKPNGTLNDEQKAILQNMKNIYIIGGEGAVSTAYEAELKKFGTVTRVFGNSRYDTSVEVAKTFCEEVDAAVIASGKNFPDGLCGGPLAAAMNAPLILTKDGGADAAAEYIVDNEISSGYVLGGIGALKNETVVKVFALESAEDIL